MKRVSQRLRLCFSGLSAHRKFEFCLRTIFHNLLFYCSSRVYKVFRRVDVYIAAKNTSRR